MALRERIEIIVSGGRPWGFSIKGGHESNNKPLTISKLEKGGKAESSGLFVGDILYSINSVILTGSRDDAVRLVKTSGYYLTVEVERGTLPGRRSGRHPSYGSNPYQTQRPHSSDYDQNYYDSMNRQYHISPEPELLHSEVDTARYFSSDLNNSTLSLNDHISSSQDVAASQDDIRENSRNVTSHYPDATYPMVKLRNKKARDRGIPTERPRSWHASKHPDSSYAKEEANMRSPGSGYLTGNSNNSTRFYQQPIAAPRRRSKGWTESGELKSVYKPEVNGSRDSLISADSHRSYRSGRLSVSSSKSSGTMSSSRGSLENLLDGSVASRYGGLESHPQPMLTNKYKTSSHPQAGIVSQQKNMFERLSHESSADVGHLNRSRDDMDRVGWTRHQSSSSAVEKRHRESEKAPHSNDHFSPAASRANDKSVARSSDGWQYDEEQESPNNRLKAELSPTLSSGVKYSDAKIVKASFDSYRKSSHQNIPEPPQRDRSSAIAVKNRYSKSFPNSNMENAIKQRRSSSPHERTPLGKSPPIGQAQPQQITSPPEASHRVTVTRPIEKTVEGSKRQERCFVVSVGDNGNIVATSMTMSPKVKDNKDANQFGENPESGSRPEPARYEHVKDLNTAKESPDNNAAADYVSRMINKATDDHQRLANRAPNTEHVKSRSDEASDSKSKGKYGSIWKTPQNQHNRAWSANFSTLVQGWSSRENTNDDSKPVDSSTSETKQSEHSLASGNTPDGDNQPSMLRSLQNTLHQDELKQKPSEQRSTRNYDLLWHAESTPNSEVSRESPSKKNNTKYKDWTSEYKDVGLDDPPDDVLSPSHSYVDNIKDMSSKVLRETSFTRKDLGVPNFTQRKKQTQHPSQDSGRKSNLYHGRSRSYGNDIDDDQSNVDNTTPSSRSSKPRPLSAGVFRNRTDRHAPVSRATVTPTCTPNPVKHSKSEPRFTSPSLGTDDVSSFSSHHKYVNQNRRVSIDVKPDSLSGSKDALPAQKADRRSAVIEYFTKKSAKSFDGSPELAYVSRSHNLTNDDAKITPLSHAKPQDCGSVRKLKNFKETRQKFLRGLETNMSRAKSTSSLVEDEAPKFKIGIQRTKMRSSERSASLENLLDTSQDTSKAPPSNGIPKSPGAVPTSSPNHTMKTSPDVSSYSTTTEITIQPPPRKHTKNHRQRISNSSSASSSTTISTLSSYSASSTASIGVFPTLGEENEQTASPSAETSTSSTPSKQSEPAPADTPTQSTNQVEVERHVRRTPIDTSTYRVQKRRSGGKPSSIDPTKRRSCPESGSKAPEPLPLPPPPPPDVQPSDVPLVSTQAITLKPLSAKSEINKSVFFNESDSKSLPAPPPPFSSQPLDGAAEKLLTELIRRRQSLDLPPPPSVPFKPMSGSELTEEKLKPDMTSVAAQLPPEPLDSLSNNNETQQTDLPISSDRRRSSTHNYENVRRHGQQYENVCGPMRDDSSPKSKTEESTESSESKKEEKPGRTPVEISPEPLLPDVPFLHDPASLQEEHPDLTRDIIKGDKALAQVLTTTSKKAIDYMTGVFTQSAHDILEEGIRYRMRKPGATDEEKEESTYQSYLTNDLSCHDHLPASSTYYKTSASKAKILNLMKEKLAGGEIALDEQENVDEVNHKKVELVLSIKTKLDDLHSMKGLLDIEKRENESLGRQVLNLIKNMCSTKELDKYATFVQEVDKIINLLLGLSARLARVENAIQMLSPDADKQEMELLCDKRKKLTEQHNDAKQLKESIDKRQKTVSEILAGCFDREQFADYEHYIKMKSALIMEQRELDDKTKLGQEQIQCLRDSLPDEWQANLDKLLEQ